MSSTNAQIGELGIYGSVTPASRNSIRYVYLAADGWVGPDHFLPVNGLKNFNFYYLPEGDGFIPGGAYRVYYYAADKLTHYGYDSVTYLPNGGHTDGVEVRPFNDPPETPRGLHGIVRGYVPNGGGATAPLNEARVFAIPLFTPADSVQVLTNANGYFSVYYSNGYTAQFLPVSLTPPSPPPHQFYYFIISGNLGECSYSTTTDLYLWEPWNVSDPDYGSYFVTRAGTDLDLLPLNPLPPCSQ